MSDDSVEQLQYTSALPVGFVDIFVFSSFVGVLFYWFVFRKPKKDEKETSDTDTR